MPLGGDFLARRGAAHVLQHISLLQCAPPAHCPSTVTLAARSTPLALLLFGFREHCPLADRHKSDPDSLKKNIQYPFVEVRPSPVIYLACTLFGIKCTHISRHTKQPGGKGEEGVVCCVAFSKPPLFFCMETWGKKRYRGWIPVVSFQRIIKVGNDLSDLQAHPTSPCPVPHPHSPEHPQRW